MRAQNILITGAGGYVGSLLVSDLLKKGHRITALDTFWFGPLNIQSPFLTVVTADIRTCDWQSLLSGIDSVIHLACVSNDPSYELNPIFSEQINVAASQRLIEACQNSSIQRFIFASSSSVYGIKKESRVTEELSLEPLTPYSKSKVEIEYYLTQKSRGHFDSVILRPATLYGNSPRLRLDVVSNLLSAQAYFEKELNVFGGDQFRPQLNIKDMIACYNICLSSEKNFNAEVFNVGENNYSVSEIGEIIESICPFKIDLKTLPSTDPRSYRICADKFSSATGFVFKSNLENGLKDLMQSFSMTPHMNWKSEQYHNIKKLKSLLEPVATPRELNSN